LEEIQTDLVRESWLSSNETGWASLVMRQYVDSPHVELEWLVGPLPDLDPGIEVVVSYDAFYTNK
jgi:hypothetical protein